MRYRSFLFAIVPLAVAVAPAMADTYITATLHSLTYAENANLVINGTEVDNNQLTGMFDWTRAGSPGNPGPNNDFDPSGNTGIPLGSEFKTFCIDLAQVVYLPSTDTYKVSGDIANSPLGPQGPMGVPAADALGRIYRADYAVPSGPVTPAEIDYETAFQLAIWDIVKDGVASNSLLDKGLSEGNFRASGLDAAVISDYDSFIADAWNTSLQGENLDAFVGVSQTSTGPQNQLFLLPSGATTSVPLPGAAAAAVPILMLGGTTLKSKHRRRQAEDSAVA